MELIDTIKLYSIRELRLMQIINKYQNATSPDGDETQCAIQGTSKRENKRVFDGTPEEQERQKEEYDELVRQQIKEWKEKFGRSISVSVNVSRIDIFDPALKEKLRKIIESNGLDEKELMLEITESAYADNAGSLTEVTNSLRESGFKIEMDDFGAGYSSLNMITTIPIDVLKLDMGFVRKMEENDKNLKLVEIILDIAKFLDVPVVAEGVETKAQLDMLKCMGCQIIQGYYFSKPVPADEFEKFIVQENG